MRINVNKTSLETRDVKSTPSHRSIPHTSHHAETCGRCGGFLVDDHCMDLDIGAGREGYRFWAMRCVQCGDMIEGRFFAIGNRDLSRLTVQDIQSNAKGVLHNAGSHSSFDQKTNSPCRPGIG